MIKGNIAQDLSMESVLEKITPFDIFNFYMPGKWKVNVTTLSPFRQEKNPSFVINNTTGNLSFIDFSQTDYRGDCFDFVKKLYGLKNLNDTLKKIDSDFGLGISSSKSAKDYKIITQAYKQPEELGKRYALVQVSTRAFTKEELAYWNQYHQDISDLKREQIYSIDKLYLNRKLFVLKDTELRFGYYYKGHWKIYRPFGDKKHKWVPNNVPLATLEGRKNIIKCKNAFINKSKKDHMVIQKVYPHSCAVQNEGDACFSEEIVGFLKENSENQILSFDSDAPGVKNSQLITEKYGFDYCNVPKIYLGEGIKDWAELGRIYGLERVEKYLKIKGIYV